MKRYRLLTLVLCVALVGLNVVLVYSGERNKSSDEFRERFVKNFQRIKVSSGPLESYSHVDGSEAVS